MLSGNCGIRWPGIAAAALPAAVVGAGFRDGDVVRGDVAVAGAVVCLEMDRRVRESETWA